MSKPPTRGRYTLDDWLARAHDEHIELVDGEIIEKAAPLFMHGVAQARVASALGRAFDNRSGDGPGGWYFGLEVDIQLGDDVFRPDIAGWRRERITTIPDEFPLSIQPDWICEVISDSNRKHDTSLKVVRYHDAGIPHYWMLDEPMGELRVYRYATEGYSGVMVARAHQRVRAEPFDAIEIDVARLLGLD